MMIERDVDSLVVKDLSERVVGFLTQRDVLRTIVDRGQVRSMLDFDTTPTGWNVAVGVSGHTHLRTAPCLRPRATSCHRSTLTAAVGLCRVFALRSW